MEKANSHAKNGEQADLNIEESMMHHDPRVYWFRDFWSNRLELNRNVQTENFEIDIENNHSYGELTVEKIKDSRCNVQSLDRRFKDLVNPYELVQKYEPYCIFLSHTLSREIDLPQTYASTGITEPKEVRTEPIAQSKSDLKKPLLLLFGSIFLLGLLTWFWSIILSSLISLIPWLEPFYLPILVLTAGPIIFLALLYSAIRIIDEITRPVKKASRTIYLYEGKKPDKFHFKYAGDTLHWLESKPYWVFRYMFLWRGELTFKRSLPIIHFPEDWERIDVWLDAKTGKVEWLVSDYHWRELWYKVEQSLRHIYTWVFPDFHTLRPINIAIEGKGELRDLYRRGHPLFQEWISNAERYTSSHSRFLREKHSRKELGDISDIVWVTLSGLWWDKWRYPLGANSELYKNRQGPVASGEQPSATRRT